MKQVNPKIKFTNHKISSETIKHEDGSITQIVTQSCDMWVPEACIDYDNTGKAELNWTDEQKKEIKEKLGE